MQHELIDQIIQHLQVCEDEALLDLILALLLESRQ